MTLYELGNEYLESAKKLRERIDYLKMLAKTKNKDEARPLNDRLALLSSEYYQMLKISYYLKQYYK